MNPLLQRILIALGASVATSTVIVGSAQNKFKKTKKRRRKTITLVVSSLASAYYPDFGVVMIGVILATLPTLIVFFAMQRQFVQGMLGSVK